MGFKIADGFVSVKPDDTGFEADLREKIAAAAEGVKAVVGLEVRPDAADAIAPAMGATLGERITAALSDTIRDELPTTLEPSFKDAGVLGGDIFTKAFGDELGHSMTDTGLLGGSLADMIGKEGAPAGESFGIKFSEAAKDSLSRSTIAEMLAPEGETGAAIVDDAGKTGREAGKKMGDEAGKAAGDGMSPLIVAALGGAAALGAPALLAGMGVALVGVEALASKSNKVIAADYSQLGKTASAALTQATAPLAGTMNQDIQTLDSSLKGLQPQLDGLFANVGPDITAMTGGITSLVSNALPGLTDAVNSSQGEVQALANGLGDLGTGVGSFFVGLTRDSRTTAAGLQSAFGLTGSALTTLGTLAGSASSAISADLMAVVPAAQAVLGVIDKLSDPATVGAGLGALAMKQWGDSLGTGLDKISSGFTSVATKASGASGLIGTAGSVADKAASGFGAMADMMGGPWGIALGAGIGLVSGLVGSLFQASHATDAITLAQQGLTQAVQADNGQMGQSVAAYVAQQAQTSGLADIAAKAGVSISSLTQAISNNKKAQQAVTESIDKSSQAARNQEVATIGSIGATGTFTNTLNDANLSVAQAAAKSNVLSDASQKLENSIKAQTGQITDAITKQQQLQAATNELDNVTNIFTASLKSGYTALQSNAQQQALSTVSALNLGSANTTLSESFYKSVTAYNVATAQASSYNSILQAMHGTTMSLDQAQNTLDQQLLTAKTSFAANSYSMSQNTQAGISNRQALVSAAQAITALGVAQYQQTGDMNAANQTIQQQISKFVAATGATGQARLAIENYLDSIAKIPANTSTTVNVDTSQASLKLNTLLYQMDQIRSTGVSVAPQETHRATGGPVTAGQSYVVGDGGRPEMFVAPTDGYIYPTVGAGQQAVTQHNAQVAGNGGVPSAHSAAAGATAGPAQRPVNIIFQGTQYPNTEQMAALQREFATAGAF